MPRGIVDKPSLPNQQPRWSWWQKALGWLRKALNAGHSVGVLPKKRHGPRF